MQRRKQNSQPQSITSALSTNDANRIIEQIKTNTQRLFSNILQQAEPLEPNITKEMQDALKRLKEDESIIVLPADKGAPA